MLTEAVQAVPAEPSASSSSWRYNAIEKLSEALSFAAFNYFYTDKFNIALQKLKSVSNEPGNNILMKDFYSVLKYENFEAKILLSDEINYDSKGRYCSRLFQRLGRMTWGKSTQQYLWPITWAFFTGKHYQ